MKSLKIPSTPTGINLESREKLFLDLVIMTNEIPGELYRMVFITNETMLRMSDAQIPALAEDILQLISSTHTVLKAKPSVQIQIDCDWNATSKNRIPR